MASSLNSVNGGAGAEVLQGVNPANSTVELRSPTSALEGDPVNRAATGQVSEARSSQAELIDSFNLEFAPSGVNADPAVTEDVRRAVTRALRNQLTKALPGKCVSVSLVRELYSLKDGKAIMDRATGIENAHSGICVTSI